MTLEELIAAATPGPWSVDPHGINDCLGDVWTAPGDNEGRICETALIEDARLIALSPDLAAALIKAREALADIAASEPCACNCGFPRFAREALAAIDALTKTQQQDER